ncbi:hypothetical protein NDU88_005183 [Pleurodeles waltl]|uniref:Uncharacterized protein n=1 Tax=Pleurodeles waltl TaxID=8319 RepID=A0AAV7PEM4_PLEWA|nr:hypothetical protein NDU88_005183 [Pleurodeles waltl]
MYLGGWQVARSMARTRLSDPDSTTATRDEAAPVRIQMRGVVRKSGAPSSNSCSLAQSAYSKHVAESLTPGEDPMFAESLLRTAQAAQTEETDPMLNKQESLAQASNTVAIISSLQQRCKMGVIHSNECVSPAVAGSRGNANLAVNQTEGDVEDLGGETWEIRHDANLIAISLKRTLGAFCSNELPGLCVAQETGNDRVRTA